MIMYYKALDISRTIEVVIVLALCLKVNSRMSSSFCTDLNVYIEWQCRIGITQVPGCVFMFLRGR